MEESAIKKGFDDLRDGHDYDPLYHSALCRAKADWLIGINATRLFSVLYNHTLNVGRVQTPTLSLLVERDNAIQNFEKKKYYLVRIGDGTFEAASPPYTEKDEAEKLRRDCDGETAVCTSLVREEKTENPPRLYDLTTLQREANRLYGYTAKQTLDYTQSLYEKKLCTYPRTDSQYLTDDMLPTAENIVSGLFGTLDFAKGVDLSPDYSRILNSRKVSDHHAIIPTAEAVKTDKGSLPESERNILLLLSMKLLSATAQPYRYEAVTASFSCGGITFTSKGKTVKCEGFKELERRFRATLKTKPEDGKTTKENPLPELSEGQKITAKAAMTEHDTTPPKAYTEDTLLSAMQEYGYSWNGMLPLKEEAALHLYAKEDMQIFLLHADGSESIPDSPEDIKAHAEKGGIFGVHKEDWNALTEYRAMKEELAGSEAAKEMLQRYGEKEQAENTFTIYQLKDDVPVDYHFRSLERLQEKGLAVDPANYEKIYTAPLTPGMNLERIFEKFNFDRPEDFKGHSLSVSDVVVLHQNGKDTAHYTDSIGFVDISKDFLLENPLRAAEQSTEQNANMIDGIINNTPATDGLDAATGEQISLAQYAETLKQDEAPKTAEQETDRITAAGKSRYDGMVALFTMDDKIHIGKSENYDNKGHYDNTDNSLLYVSDCQAAFTFLTSEGYIHSQDEALKQGIYTEAAIFTKYITV